MSGRKLNEDWTADVVGRCHKYRINRSELASKCHYSLTYISMVLNGIKEFSSERAKERTKAHILKCLSDIEAEIEKEIKLDEESEVDWREYFNKARNLKEK